MSAHREVGCPAAAQSPWPRRSSVSLHPRVPAMVDPTLKDTSVFLHWTRDFSKQTYFVGADARIFRDRWDLPVVRCQFSSDRHSRGSSTLRGFPTTRQRAEERIAHAFARVGYRAPEKTGRRGRLDLHEESIPQDTISQISLSLYVFTPDKSGPAGLFGDRRMSQLLPSTRWSCLIPREQTDRESRPLLVRN